MLCLVMAGQVGRRLKVQVDSSSPGSAFRSGCRVHYHMNGLVVVLEQAFDTTKLKSMLDQHWDTLPQLSLGDEGFDKVRSHM